MASATAGRRAHSATGLPPSASTLAKVVPQLPAPSTAMRSATLRRGSRCGAASELAGFRLSVDGGVPALGRRGLAAELLEQRGDRRHDRLGRLLERDAVSAAGPSAEVDGLADDDVD